MRRPDPTDPPRASEPQRTGPGNLDLQPHPHRVTEDYADARIREKIEWYEDDRPKMGLENVNEALREEGVPPAWRLHYITHIAHLGRHADASLTDRVFRALKAHNDAAETQRRRRKD